MSQRVYVPKSYAKEIDGQYGPFISVAFDAAALVAFVQANKTKKGTIRFNISPRREADKYGNTHSVSLDTWEPRQQQNAPQAKPAPTRANSDTDECPF